ncbi:tax1-binding protein 3-like isoform X1 [Myxocyprinus asiaticus]|uniref:tax1-binding protein 3-like isoform X1 n=1 Tax=Myxocyprinus asiaticus TaxID=70543 RepID=UPI00222230E6|nr:tax1-binding protein 3-like isoform X1 [Myxocyprinus asiaticus]
MSYIPGQPVTAVVQRIEIQKLRDGANLILGFSIGGGIDQDSSQNPFSEDKSDKGIYVTRVSKGGPAEVAGLRMGDKIMQLLLNLVTLACYITRIPERDATQVPFTWTKLHPQELNWQHRLIHLPRTVVPQLKGINTSRMIK